MIGERFWLLFCITRTSIFRFFALFLQALNALNLEMIEAILRVLRAWKTDDAVLFVLIRGAGDRALCAGKRV